MNDYKGKIISFRGFSLYLITDVVVGRDTMEKACGIYDYETARKITQYYEMSQNSVYLIYANRDTLSSVSLSAFGNINYSIHDKEIII